MALVIGVHGPSGSGKTRLIEQLISRLSARGLKVGVIKHTHDGVELDAEGKDSWRMWQAGAQAVLAAAPHEVFVRQRSQLSSLNNMLGLLPKVLDCIFVEGFTQNAHAMGTDGSMRLELLPEGIRVNGNALLPHDPRAIETLIVSLLGAESSLEGVGMARPHPATQITVKVLLFAQLRDRFRADELAVSLPSSATGRDLMDWFVRRNPKAEDLLEVSRLAVNGEYVSLDHVLQDQDEAVLIPPVSGG